ncbi:hypothetical protein A2V68_03110 [candidate division Kazan bacterium RBG_13_50_9]|uniref:Orotate phosphoribosyltransferase n=1 Tax=candidate division Kazan bacterium RBG_13_50_9 TaxID=1798535 RepID=A0A1F4NSZ8_UNCK3|nr:MAG: hypothetical protein A2V68_03110 [candidate division Kazan bacterium RBG_13_50_9]
MTLLQRLSITELPSLERLLEAGLSVGDLSEGWPNGRLTLEEVTHLFKLCGALWLYPYDCNNPSAPHQKVCHAELTSGKCSTGFIDVLKVLCYPKFCEILAYSLWEEVQNQTTYDTSRINWVIGSAYAGITFSYELSKLFSARHGFTEKGESKTQVWKRGAFEVQPGEVVLQVEELMTTAGTALAVREGIRQGNPSLVEFAPFVATLVHRSEVTEIEGAPVIYLAHYNIQTWAPEECPLCQLGAKRVKPKDNWVELTQRRHRG